MQTVLYNEYVFVFGSNLAGRHGKGAALHAKQCWGAQQGVGEGRTGRSYAIPTKDERLRVRDLNSIQTSVESFVEYAKTREQTLFEVTRVGCVLAGYKDVQIAPMFLNAPDNCRFHHDWQMYITKARKEWIVYYTARGLMHCVDETCWCKADVDVD